MKDIKIRKATKNDLNELIKLNQKLFDYEYKNFDKTLDCSWPKKNKKYFLDAITKTNAFTRVAVCNEKIIGYLIGTIHKEGWIRKIKKIAEADDSYIEKEFRRKGIGTKFMKEFLNWTKTKKVKRVKAVINSQNKKSIGWNKKLGFKDYTVILEKDL